MIVAVVGLERESRIVGGPDIAVSRRGADLSPLIAQGAQGIISIGIAAALDPAFKVGDVVIGSHVSYDRSFDTNDEWSRALAAGLEIRRFGGIAGCDHPVASAEEKTVLRLKTSAVAADMESHIAAMAAATARVPFAVLRVVSDAANESLPPAAAAAMRADGSIDMGAVMGSLLRRPGQISALMRTAQNAEIAFKALLRCRNALGPRLACPDFG